jgi:hypothetical protein
MLDGSEIESLIDSLDALVDEAEGGSNKWKGVWNEIKSIGQAFKETRFSTVADRQTAWKRFQAIIARVKADQNRAKEEFDKKIRESECHLEQLRSYAYSATPSSDMADAIIAICTGGLSFVIEAGLDALLGPFDERKYELQQCSQALKDGWAYLSQHKGEMLGKHKQQAFAALNSAKESLDSAWETWKAGRQQALDQYHAERRASRDAHHAEKRAEWETRQAKREAWEAHVHENISNLESRIARLEDVLEHKRSHLSELEDKRSSAWSDAFRDRVDGWISEEESRVADIESQLERLRSWLEEARTKLR